METIHLKTVDPLSQELLKSAYQRGIRLNWDRYEKLQPQDGFLRVGLSCPYGCLQGPCRIDPFGRGPDRGLCGLDRDQMVAALLLRLTLSGSLEAMDETAGGNGSDRVSLPPRMEKIFAPALKKLGGPPLSVEDISRSAFYLHRPMESPGALILQAMRLGVLALGLPEKKKTSKGSTRPLSMKVGYGLLAQEGVIAGVSGKPSSRSLQAILKEVARNSTRGGQLVSLGDWIPFEGGLLPPACTSGEAELVLSSRRIHLLIAGPGTDPSLVELCRSLKVPLTSSQDSKEAGDFVRRASQEMEAYSSSFFAPDPALVEETEVMMTPGQWEGVLKKEPSRKIALIGGADHLQHPLGWIPSEVGSSLQGEGYGVAGWGDAALWMLKKGLARNKPPVRILESQQGPVLALKALAGLGRTKDLKGVCFAGLKSCRDLAVALGIAALGVRVCVAVPLPLWGSEEVRKLLEEKLAAQGGSLTHFDHPAQAQEILDWFLKN